MEKQTTNQNNKFSLFTTFFKIGAFTFGGGYAMIPLIQKEVVENKKWVTDQDILDIIAIAESTPGPISVNTATFIGYKLFGIFGAFIATFGLVLPSFLIILTISLFLKEFQNVEIVQLAFKGIRAGILALILKALFTMYKQCPKSALSYTLIAFSFLSTSFLNLSPLVAIIFCAISGILHSFITTKITARRNK